MMFKTILLAFCLSLPVITFAQEEDPGFGADGEGDAADAPQAPIDDLTYPLLITGVAASIYFAKKKQEKEQTQ